MHPKIAAFVLLAAAFAAAKVPCADGNAKTVSCATDATACARAFANLMSPVPTCQNATGVCACPAPPPVPPPAPPPAPPAAALSAPELALTQKFIDTTCSSATVANTTAIDFVLDHILNANRVEAPPRAAGQVLFFAMLAHSGGIPTPKGRLGKTFFGGYMLCTGVQLLYTLLSIASYVAAWASFSSAHAACLVPWLHGRTYFDMTAFGTLGFHPQLLAYACILAMYVLGVVEARRVWCAVNLNRDVGYWWVRSGWRQHTQQIQSTKIAVAYIPRTGLHPILHEHKCNL